MWTTARVWPNVPGQWHEPLSEEIMMRGIGEHVPPVRTQDAPADNTSGYVQAQAAQWVASTLATGREDHDLIHTESAREIAAWYQSPGSTGEPFAVFASAGKVTRDLLPAIGDEIGKYGPEPVDAEANDVNALRALAAYVTNRRTTSGYTPCACTDCLDVAVSSDETILDLCGLCEDAGCMPDGGDCERPDAYQG
jgi:hypothetical protein